MKYILNPIQFEELSLINNEGKGIWEPEVGEFDIRLDDGFLSKGEPFEKHSFWFNNIKDSLEIAIVPVKPVYLRVALDHFGLLEIIENILENPENKEVQIYFEYALLFERDDEMLNQFAHAVGLTTEQMDSIFEYADSVQG